MVQAVGGPFPVVARAVAAVGVVPRAVVLAAIRADVVGGLVSYGAPML